MTGVSFPVSHHTSQNNQKARRGGTVEALLLCMLGWASDRVREIMTALWGNSVKRHPVGSEFASSRPCMCWQSAELSPSGCSWLREKAHVCVRLRKLLILLQGCLHGSMLSRGGTVPLSTVLCWALPPLQADLGNGQFACCKRVAAKLSFSHLVPI